MADLLHIAASNLARNPTDVILRRGNFSVQRQRSLHGYQWFTGAHEVDVGFIQPFGKYPGFLVEIDFDTGCPQLCETLSGDLRIRILHCCHDTRHARCDHLIGTRPGTSLMRAGLEGHIQGSATGRLASFAQSYDFRVILVRPEMKTAADLAPIIHDEGAYGGIRACLPAAL